MPDLASYDISFPYGVTTAPYSPEHPHRGDDRAAPLGTPIIVSGVTIGFVGNTGYAFGTHCHAHEWQGNKLNVRKPQNWFKPGVVIEVDRDGTTGDKTLGKYVTIKCNDGWNVSYCHMNMTNANVGQVIGGDMEVFNEGDRVNWNRTTYGGDRDWHKQFVNGKYTYKQAVDGIWKTPEHINEVRVNSGDEVNINAKLPGVGTQVKGKLWKDATNVYIMPKITTTNVTPTPLGKGVWEVK